MARTQTGFSVQFNRNDPEDMALLKEWAALKEEESINNCKFFKRAMRKELEFRKNRPSTLSQ